MPFYRLRPARSEDADAIATVWYAGWRDGHLGNVPEALVAVRTPESFQVRAAARIADTVVADTVVADPGDVVSGEVGGGIAGFVTVVDDEAEQVYVAYEHRGSGVAQQLLAEAERLIATAGHRRAWLAVADGNARARRFYARCGWTDDGMFDYRVEVQGGTAILAVRRYVKAL
ncbi:ribosomal protein S18 acetylase RimI-like enzyme [Micromonospora pisi]|uniref:Ribosomal protein S18 acetylase RimI-like enzyme n=1 Tax=Micromonospora pisi TaxID=589240 RepID=A0A495JVL1_9ACTN|nr:GNAT family N-acetyltransferase [Micromonospora pisi]RKR92618.1 ribosomal protein S18 acetylase RimI-like enzyme [Micromonospora pisi]